MSTPSGNFLDIYERVARCSIPAQKSGRGMHKALALPAQGRGLTAMMAGRAENREQHDGNVDVKSASRSCRDVLLLLLS